MSDGNYEVGYSKPPKHTQFKAGQSGNPKGRPGGARGLKTELQEELHELIQIKEQGKSKKISKQRAILKALTAKAVQGDTKAANLLINMMFRLFHPEIGECDVDGLSAEDTTILENFLKRSRNNKNEEKCNESGH